MTFHFKGGFQVEIPTNMVLFKVHIQWIINSCHLMFASIDPLKAFVTVDHTLLHVKLIAWYGVRRIFNELQIVYLSNLL